MGYKCDEKAEVFAEQEVESDQQPERKILSKITDNEQSVKWKNLKRYGCSTDPLGEHFKNGIRRSET